MNPTIVTHTALDWDAIGSTWLLLRFVPELASAKVVFVGQTPEEISFTETATAAVDTGRQWDPARWRFDHHQDDLGKTTCATRQVYEYLCSRNLPDDQSLRLKAIAPLVTLIYKGDTAQFDETTEQSNTLGLHALLTGEKKRLRAEVSATQWDERTLEFGMGLLDRIMLELGERLRRQTEEKGEVVYTSADGLVCATKHGNSNSLFSKGVVLAVYENEPFVVSGGATTYPVGVARAHGIESPHIGQLITKMLAERTDMSPELRAEVESWWLHPAGFMGGRGSARVPRSTPVNIDIAEFAKMLDEAWER